MGQSSQSLSVPLQGGIRFFPRSHTHNAVSVPCGLPSSKEEHYGLTVFRLSNHDRLGSLFPPVVLCCP